MSRLYDEDEQRRVLALAAELQARRAGVAGIEELEAAAASAGIEPRFVREAARSLDQPPTAMEDRTLMWSLVVTGLAQFLAVTFAMQFDVSLAFLPAVIATIWLGYLSASRRTGIGPVSGFLVASLLAMSALFFSLQLFGLSLKGSAKDDLLFLAFLESAALSVGMIAGEISARRHPKRVR